jgi:hypothetical protein
MRWVACIGKREMTRGNLHERDGFANVSATMECDIKMDVTNSTGRPRLD